jgi:exonuclease SbcC
VRPVKLRLENFAPFRGQAAELDFASLELFAISGPTGAGKSTLLDAIIFALYGSVPRLGRRATEMISLGADRMSVVFDFQIGTTHYRVSRLARRRGAGTAQLELLGLDDNAQPLREGVREVNDEIVRIVGLSYDAFTQAVILPQGEFQKFLKSEPRERREILSKILRVEIYERMRHLASGKRDMLAQAVQERERRLNEDYAEATPEALEELKGQTKTLHAEIETLSGRLGKAEARRDTLRTAREKTRELEQRRARLTRLQGDEPQIRLYESQLDAARHAAPVMPLIRAARTAEERSTQAGHAHDALVKDHARVQAEHNEAERRLKQATEDAKEVPLLEERISSLDQVIGRMRPRPALVTELAETKNRRLDTESNLKEACTAQHKAEDDLAAARLSLRDADKALAGVKFDRALFDTLDATREEASSIADLRAAVAMRAAEVRTAKGRLKDKEEALARANTVAQGAEEEWKRASQGIRDVDQERAEARHLAAAAVLRKELRIGELCPVCEHPVAEHPLSLTTPVLDSLEQKFEQVRHAESKARDLTDKAKQAAAEARAAAIAEQQIIDQSSQRCNAAETKLAKACEALEKRVRMIIAVSGERPIEEQVQENYRLAVACRQRHEAARKARDDSDRAVQRLERSTERLRGTVTTRTDQLAQHDNKIAELTRQIAEIDEEIRKITQAPDPQAERAELNGRRGNIISRLQVSQAAETRTAGDLSRVAARLETSEETLKKAKAEARRARAEALGAAVAAGFTDEAAAAQSELNRTDEQQISRRVEAHRHECRAVEARISELIDELRGEEVAEDTLGTAEDTVAQLREGLRTAENTRAEVNARIEILTNAIDRVKTLREDLERQRVEHSVYRSLALDLRSDRFQAFLLQETFRELVSGASIRLWDLTKRYRFDWENEAFYVIDHDNARQMRSADTLSGGETFLASLALALQLSEQVQKAAGATMLDSLFIDEGFGTLDPEALDAAAGAIENLPVGGRMVGIITHIEELSLRLPARVRVEKTPDGSRLMLEAA